MHFIHLSGYFQRVFSYIPYLVISMYMLQYNLHMLTVWFIYFHQFPSRVSLFVFLYCLYKLKQLLF